MKRLPVRSVRDRFASIADVDNDIITSDHSYSRVYKNDGAMHFTKFQRFGGAGWLGNTEFGDIDFFSRALEIHGSFFMPAR